ncbi:MAG: hypothetical protein ACOZNI_23100 [Myxococcota bacterium]
MEPPGRATSSWVGAALGCLAGGAAGYPVGIHLCESGVGGEGALSALCVLAGYVGIPVGAVLGAVLGGAIGVALFPARPPTPPPEA